MFAKTPVAGKHQRACYFFFKKLSFIEKQDVIFLCDLPVISENNFIKRIPSLNVKNQVIKGIDSPASGEFKGSAL
jgi:hypothetical protein